MPNHVGSAFKILRQVFQLRNWLIPDPKFFMRTFVTACRRTRLQSCGAIVDATMAVTVCGQTRDL